jgi:hypothetical protein
MLYDVPLSSMRKNAVQVRQMDVDHALWIADRIFSETSGRGSLGPGIPIRYCTRDSVTKSDLGTRQD